MRNEARRQINIDNKRKHKRKKYTQGQKEQNKTSDKSDDAT